jgi:hypothetical protein
MYGVEEAVRRQVGSALLIQAGNPANRARRDNGLEGVMRQAMAKMGFVEHAKAFLAVAPAVSPAWLQGKRVASLGYRSAMLACKGG